VAKVDSRKVTAGGILAHAESQCSDSRIRENAFRLPRPLPKGRHAVALGEGVMEPLADVSAVAAGVAQGQASWPGSC
jgi:hypothetical protein